MCFKDDMLAVSGSTNHSLPEHFILLYKRWEDKGWLICIVTCDQVVCLLFYQNVKFMLLLHDGVIKFWYILKMVNKTLIYSWIWP